MHALSFLEAELKFLLKALSELATEDNTKLASSALSLPGIMKNRDMKQFSSSSCSGFINIALFTKNESPWKTLKAYDGHYSLVIVTESMSKLDMTV